MRTADELPLLLLPPRRQQMPAAAEVQPSRRRRHIAPEYRLVLCLRIREVRNDVLLHRPVRTVQLTPAYHERRGCSTVKMLGREPIGLESLEPPTHVSSSRPHPGA